MIGDERPTQSAEQRRTPRKAVETRVTLHLDADPIEGMSDNLSRAGIMLFTDEPIRCSVDVQEEGATRRFEGRIVRLQRMSESNTGLAVEFDVE